MICAYVVEPGPTQEERIVRTQLEPLMNDRDWARLLSAVGEGPKAKEDFSKLPHSLLVSGPYSDSSPVKKPLPHIFGPNSGPFIMSPQARAELENLEPGVHRFHEVDVIEKATLEKLGRYSFVLSLPRLDCFDMERTEWDRGNVGYLPSVLGPKGRVVLRRDVISGRHLWRGPNLFPLSAKMLCSADFRKAMEVLEPGNIKYRLKGEAR